jgi:hypothetical protein
VAALRSQARQPALHVHLWLDHMKALTKGSASSKRAAADKGGPGDAGSGQGRKEGKYTLDAALDQSCKFHSTPGREATHSTCQCRFIKELELRAQQLPGAPQAQPAAGQEGHQHERLPRSPTKATTTSQLSSSSTTSSPLRGKTKGTTFGTRRR